MATGGRIEVNADETGGRALAQQKVNTLPSGVTEIEYDTEELLDQAADWQAKANILRELAPEAREITEWAEGASGEFKSEYETPGVYNNTYTDCGTGSDRIEKEVTKLADDIERWAQSIQWMAENMEEVQKIAANRTEQIDADVSGGAGSGSAVDESARKVDVLSDSGETASQSSPMPPTYDGGSTPVVGADPQSAPAAPTLDGSSAPVVGSRSVDGGTTEI